MEDANGLLNFLVYILASAVMKEVDFLLLLESNLSPMQ